MSHSEHLVTIASDAQDEAIRRLRERMVRGACRRSVDRGPGGGGCAHHPSQELAVADVRQCVSFCWNPEWGIAGVLENMSGYVCPQCGVHTGLFAAGGGERPTHEMPVTFLGRIPIDPRLVEWRETGTCIQEREYASLADAWVSPEELR